MNDSNIKQYRFTLNLRRKEDKELHDILRKQKNMSLYIKSAVMAYHNSNNITKSDLKEMESRIISEIEGLDVKISENYNSDQRADKSKDIKSIDIKNMI